MANAKEIKGRIASVSDTAKITNAMYLISSTKMQKAKKQQAESSPYFEAVHDEVGVIFRHAPDADSRYFFREGEDRRAFSRMACLVITADKGLCGSYNVNVIRKAEKVLEDYPDTRFYVIGDYGRRYFEKHGIEYQKSFNYLSRIPSLEEARDICSVLIDKYDNNKVDRVYVIYTEMINSLTSEAKITRMLPFDRETFDDARIKAAGGSLPGKPIAANDRYEFIPSAGAALDTALRSLAVGFVYGAMVASFCSEQNCRMIAMDSANDNAAKILEELKLKYNRVRQTAITNEIIEVSAGELAQKRKRLKNKASLREIEVS